MDVWRDDEGKQSTPPVPDVAHEMGGGRIGICGRWLDAP
jgi:hypothetical protein